MSYTLLEKDYSAGKPILQDDGYWQHIEWTHANGEKTITKWRVNTFEHALECVNQIMGRE